MSSPSDPRDVEVPPGTEEIVGVYVNGVELQRGEDYEVEGDRIRFRTPLRERERVGRLGNLLLSVGIGVYPKGDVVDLQIRRGGRTDIVRGRLVGQPR